MAEIDFGPAWRSGKSQFIDLRSPGEYAADHIPGALNLPLFDNEQRKEIGTAYHQQSGGEAGYLGLTYALPKVASLVKEIEQIGQERRAVLYCWRGGARSRSLYALCHSLKVDCDYLVGGYRSYRRQVSAYFDRPCAFKPVVLCGLTGVGKTDVLSLLQQKGLQTVDLEALARHRGSAFGDLGFCGQPTQKAFESSLWACLDKYDQDQPLFVECESRRIGNNIIPAVFFEAMKAAPTCLLYDSIANRVKRIMADYRPAERSAEIYAALLSLAGNIGKTRSKQLILEAKTGNYLYVVEQLLSKYYDPLYGYADRPSGAYDLCIETADENSAAEMIRDYFGNAGCGSERYR